MLLQFTLTCCTCIRIPEEFCTINGVIGSQIVWCTLSGYTIRSAQSLMELSLRLSEEYINEDMLRRLSE